MMILGDYITRPVAIHGSVSFIRSQIHLTFAFFFLFIMTENDAIVPGNLPPNKLSEL